MGNVFCSCRKRKADTEAEQTQDVHTSLIDFTKSPGPRRARFLEAVSTPVQPQSWPSPLVSDKKASEPVEIVNANEVELWMKERMRDLEKEVEARRSTPSRNRVRPRLTSPDQQEKHQSTGVIRTLFGFLGGSSTGPSSSSSRSSPTDTLDINQALQETTTTTTTTITTTTTTTLGGDGSLEISKSEEVTQTRPIKRNVGDDDEEEEQDEQDDQQSDAKTHDTKELVTPAKRRGSRAHTK